MKKQRLRSKVWWPEIDKDVEPEQWSRRFESAWIARLWGEWHHQNRWPYDSFHLVHGSS